MIHSCDCSNDLHVLPEKDERSTFIMFCKHIIIVMFNHSAGHERRRMNQQSRVEHLLSRPLDVNCTSFTGDKLISSLDTFARVDIEWILAPVRPAAGQVY